MRAFARSCGQDGLTDAVLLGMGGSSLAPEVLRASFEAARSGASPNGRAAGPDGALRLRVLDSTDPGAVLGAERDIDLSRTLFLVSTKSGGTIETLSLFRYFHDRVKESAGDGAGGHFAAITDPGSSLLDLAREHGFRRSFVNDPNIGGRYSALSMFGLVPAALMGFDIDALLESAEVAEQACLNFDASSNSGLWLGLALGALAQQGRDKLTFVVSEPISSFGLWAEQLVAESTGKQGRGILPVADEPLGDPDAYGEDRVFAYLPDVLQPDPQLDAHAQALAQDGHPVITLPTRGPGDLGRVFMLWELAVAVAGWGLEINPFDQPNVQQAKDATARVLADFERRHELPSEPATDADAAAAWLAEASPPGYVAIMGYLRPSEDFDAAVAELRRALRGPTKATTTFGYGPRFLHSTGQFHKGGPKIGRFLQLLHDEPPDVEIPGAGYGFTTLKNAQAIGDLETLRALGLRAERVRLRDEPASEVLGLAAGVNRNAASRRPT